MQGDSVGELRIHISMATDGIGSIPRIFAQGTAHGRANGQSAKSSTSEMDLDELRRSHQVAPP